MNENRGLTTQNRYLAWPRYRPLLPPLPAQSPNRINKLKSRTECHWCRADSLNRPTHSIISTKSQPENKTIARVTNLRILLPHTVCQHPKLEWSVRLIFSLLLVYKHLVPQHFIDQSSFDIHLGRDVHPWNINTYARRGRLAWTQNSTYFMSIKQRRGQNKTFLVQERNTQQNQR